MTGHTQGEQTNLCHVGKWYTGTLQLFQAECLRAATQQEIPCPARSETLFKIARWTEPAYICHFSIVKDCRPVQRCWGGLKTTNLFAFLLVFVSLAWTRSIRAQVFDLANERPPLAEMHGLWHFHTGDDLHWADPKLDDSHWQLLRSDESWSEQGYKDYAGMAWYRFKLILPARHSGLGLYIPELSTSYQVFANGRLIGQLGGLPPHAEDITGGFAKGRQTIPLPDDLAPQNGVVTIAIRVWHWEHRAYNPGGPLSAISVGDIKWLAEWRTLQFRDAFWSTSAQSVLMLSYALAGFAGLGLFALRRNEREYLWFAAFSFFAAAFCYSNIYPAFYLSKWQHYQAIQGALTWARSICFLLFLASILKARRGWVFWLAVVSITSACLSDVPGAMAWISLQMWVVVGILFGCPFLACLLIMLLRAARRGNLDARLLLAPFALWGAGTIAELTVIFLYTSGHLGYTFYATFRELVSWPMPIPFTVLTEFLEQLSVLAILVLRFARTRRDEERMATELESARVVQSVLIPTEIPSVAGFDVSAVYRPATQVGGDFFQIIPTANAGVLVVIGDVSGKGMPAAMTVSLLVGTLRTLAHYTASPGEILQAMNRRMLARNAGGFTTCLVLRIDPDGTLVVANAGHIAPYLNRIELPIESSLPLGLAADALYSESSFEMTEHVQLTLMTDGVVEARSKSGELLGFERTKGIASESAESIAQAAQDFGQEDDITVLTIVRLCAGEQSSSHVTTSELSPSPA
jgi:serine phosphatase RsbU (regulator of sigma subunit)